MLKTTKGLQGKIKDLDLTKRKYVFMDLKAQQY